MVRHQIAKRPSTKVGGTVKHQASPERETSILTTTIILGGKARTSHVVITIISGMVTTEVTSLRGDAQNGGNGVFEIVVVDSDRTATNLGDIS